MNISPATLLTPAAGEFLGRLPLERILLELSEHDQVEDYDALDAVLAPLRERGMRLAIDDVGAGFSSLRHIVLTRPDVLKIDRTLVDGVSHDPILTTLVRSLVDFGHGMGAKVVAEGVETGGRCGRPARSWASTSVRAGTSAVPGRSPTCSLATPAGHRTSLLRLACWRRPRER